MDEKKFNNIMARAQKMILSEEFNNKVDAYSMSAKKNGGFGNAQISSMEAQVFGFNGNSSQEQPKQMVNEQTYAQPTQQASDYFNNQFNTQNVKMLEEIEDKQEINYDNLPAAIRESFKRQGPVIVNPDDVMESPLDKMQKNLKTVKPQINEQKVQYTSNGMVDYGLIKNIVEECVRRNSQSLNENLVRGLKMGKGNKITFVDSKGNIYEGVLKLKKKAAK